MHPKILATLAAVALFTAAPAADELPSDGMVRFPGATFRMGSEHGHDDEKPVHDVRVDAFRIDRTEVTNRQFAAFVEATGHVTRAERDGYAWGFLEGDTDFRKIPGASWRHPDGPDSSYRERLDHPVVCVTWHDARAYAAWAGKRLPTEAEWEYAARAGGGAQVHAEPDVVGPGGDAAGAHEAGAHEAGKDAAGSHEADAHDAAEGTCPHGGCAGAESAAARDGGVVEANVWNGRWPEYRRRLHGSFTTTPVGSFPANGAGLVDMIGNVWEWTADWYDADWYAVSPDANPRGPDQGRNRVARGGSWFCSPDYCAAYTSHYRGASPPDRAFNNVGFRCADDVEDGQ